MSCCSPEGTCHTDSQAAETPAANTAVYTVAGMTCGHCEAAVTKELTGVAGVTTVTVDVSTGLVTVASEQALEDETVRAAVDEAGYELVGRA
ncbi:heavy-metal-associated domain-containing protein [Streptomyces sp. H10-C2]|uniref:heavy-metal-associated domain-containing protein n=1 Tax=unclassified Streptomyces TaxID=2593676 RepID=UPI0024BA988E|nr:MULTISPECIES: heavy-metal-associated domain-containing protein [unclassified Streptomyces]MDJ0342309.1 heavy-metal-associated domain-containing protein [Streptomyces sp. PH10-H1]MDJ0372164.1 heavy-metal-associated domain-containing protein [Streptomyces sp. H10-C2]